MGERKADVGAARFGKSLRSTARTFGGSGLFLAQQVQPCAGKRGIECLLVGKVPIDCGRRDPDHARQFAQRRRLACGTFERGQSGCQQGVAEVPVMIGFGRC